jgi:hypothetical protein
MHPIASTIGGATGDADIAEMWSQHFRALLNSSTKDDQKPAVIDELSHLTDRDYVYFTEEECKTAISKLKQGVSPGPNHLTSEHLIYADALLPRVLSKLFTAMLVHNHTPEKLTSTILVCKVKDKKESITDKDNYRPIALTTTLSKTLESIILEKYSGMLDTTYHQFGYKKNHSADQCLFLFKEVVNYYNSLSTPVFACFVDASKAFDRVNFWIMYTKLLQRNIPKVIVRLLLTWYATQTFVVRWNCTFSKTFQSSNGVRQGGVLSPRLFNIYMDDLSKALSRCNSGCTMGDVCLNHLFYADDAVLMSPSIHGLQHLIDICTTYGFNHEILYNKKKTVCMSFYPKCYEGFLPLSVYLSGAALKWVDKKEYLGCVLQPNGAEVLDRQRIISSIYAKGNAVVRRFSHCSEDIKCELFRSYFSSLYGCSVWSSFSDRDFRKVKVAFNNVFRSLFCIKGRVGITGHFLRNKLLSFLPLYRKCCFSLFQRVFKSDNELLVFMRTCSHFIFNSKLLKKWKEKLFSFM